MRLNSNFHNNTKNRIKKKLRRDIHSLEKIVSYNMQEYEQRWKLIKNSYGHIYVCRLYVGAIGEFICRYLMIKEDIEKDRCNLYVFIPYMDEQKEISNRNLMNLLSNEICIVNYSNYEFWKHVIKNHNKDLNFKYYEKYEGRRDIYYHVYRNKPLLHLGNVQEKIGRAISGKIGISQDYVCFHNREEQYNIVIRGKDFDFFRGRNSNFESYSESINYLQERSIQAVRMGKYVTAVNDNIKFVDYAGKYYADFMDIFLLSNCKFFVGSNSGVNFVPRIFAKPILMVNAVYVSVGAGSDINMEENMMIFKKYYNKRTKRYLSLKAIANYERKFADNTSQYEKYGIVLIDNTPQEILDAVIEMNQRLDGLWKETEEDKELQSKYKKIVSELNAKNRRKFWNGGATMYRIGSQYLRENRYLIEE